MTEKIVVYKCLRLHNKIKELGARMNELAEKLASIASAS